MLGYELKSPFAAVEGLGPAVGRGHSLKVVSEVPVACCHIKPLLPGFLPQIAYRFAAGTVHVTVRSNLVFSRICWPQPLPLPGIHSMRNSIPRGQCTTTPALTGPLELGVNLFILCDFHRSLGN
jgi:hypothetical protein